MAAFPSSFHFFDSSIVLPPNTPFNPQFYNNPIQEDLPFHNNNNNPKKFSSSPNNNDHQASVSVLSVANTIKRRRTRQPKGVREVKAKKQKKMEDKKSKEKKKATAVVAPTEYVHVRAKRGQATDSHSLAERVRRERISERMKLLQALVPGCDKVTGKALMLDEIINYVQSLQNQVEFLSMKLASVNPMFYDFGMDWDPFVVGHDQDTTTANMHLLDNTFSTPSFQPPQILPNAIIPQQQVSRQGLMWDMEDQRPKINDQTGNNNTTITTLFSFH